MVTVLFFAAARERAGLPSETLALDTLFPTGAARDGAAPIVVADVVNALGARHPLLRELLPRCRVAVDQRFAAPGDPVRDGAEIALIPPVAGG